MNINIKLVVLNYQSYADTIDYVNSVVGQKNVSLRIVVVDNASLNNSFDYLSKAFDSYENVKVIQSDVNGGYASGNNIGIREGERRNHELVIVSNNDLVINDDNLFYKWGLKHRELDNVAITSPIMCVNEKPSDYMAWKLPTFKDSIRSSLMSFEKLLGDPKKYIFENDSSEDVIDVECVPGSLFMVELDLIEKIGFLDEGTFLYMEEVILARRVLDLGLKNYILKGLSYEHLVSKTISNEIPSFKMREHLLDSICYYHKKYNNVPDYLLSLLRKLNKIRQLEEKLFYYIKKLRDK